MNRGVALVNFASLGALTSFYLMLGVTPLFAIQQGYDAFSAAITTSVFMLTTVAAELVTNPVMRRFGQKATLAFGSALLALPAFVLLASGSLAAILLVSAIRGIGFALVIIAGAAMIAALTEESRHGRGLALYGVVVGIPSILALPFGVWLVNLVGFAPLFIASGSIAALGVVVALVRFELPTPDEVHGMLRTLRRPAVLRLALAFTAASLASGVLLTWTPIAVGSRYGAPLAAGALLASGASATLARWIAGRLGDRKDARLLLVPALTFAAVGLLVSVLVPPFVIIGALVFGAGFGALQNATLQLMLKSAGPSGYGSASAIWNAAFDAGLGIGAFSFAALASNYALPIIVSAAAVSAAIIGIALSSRAVVRQPERVGTP